MTIGDRIKAAREKAQMTQSELGNRTGVSGVSIMRYEKNQRQPRLEQLYAIADALNIPIEDLFGIDPENRVVTPADKLLMFFDDLNADGQQKAIERVYELTEIPRYQAAKSLLGLPRHLAVTITDD